MTKVSLATRAAASLCAALISTMSLVACGGGDEDSGEVDPVAATEPATCGPDGDGCGEPSVEPNREPAADPAREPKRRTKKPATDRETERTEEVRPAKSSGSVAQPAVMSAEEFCDAFTQQEVRELLAQADKPRGARKMSEYLDDLADEAPKRIQEDIELLAELFDEIAEANGDPDKIAAIDTSDFEKTYKHLERWKGKHC